MCLQLDSYVNNQQTCFASWPFFLVKPSNLKKIVVVYNLMVVVWPRDSYIMRVVRKYLQSVSCDQFWSVVLQSVCKVRPSLQLAFNLPQLGEHPCIHVLCNQDLEFSDPFLITFSTERNQKLPFVNLTFTK